MSGAGPQCDDSFDPYYHWLAIPPDEQPPNLYRLLGLRPGEDNPEVIAIAADRQMAHIKTFAAGKYSQHSQQLLNELAQAKIHLLNPARKSAYDSQLGWNSPGAAAAGEQAAPFDPLTFAAPESSSFSRAQSHRRQGRKTGFNLVIHGLFAAIGLSLGYFVLCMIGPQYDFLHLVHRASSSPVVGRQSSPSPSAAETRPPTRVGRAATSGSREKPASTTAPEPRPTRDATPRGRPGDDRPATGIPERPVPRQGNGGTSRLAPPDETPPRSLTANLDRPESRVTTPFAEFPATCQLPTPLEREAPLGEVAAEHAPSLELELLQPDNRRRAARKFTCVSTGEPSLWSIYFANQSERDQIVESRLEPQVGATVIPPVAQLAIADRQLVFRWLPDAAEAPWERLGNSLLIMRANGNEHVCQLRKIERQDALTILRRSENDEIQVTIKELPPKSQLYLEVSRLEGFPPLTHFQGDAERIAEGQTAFWKFDEADYAGVAATWKRSKDRVTITTTVGVKYQSTADALHILSTELLPGQEEMVNKILTETRREGLGRERERARLEREIRIARQIQLQGLRRQAVDKATQKRNANDSRIGVLRRLRQFAEADLPRFTTLRRLAAEIEGRGTIGFRLYTEASGRKIVFFETYSGP